MTKEVVLNLDEELIKKLDKQFKETIVDTSYPAKMD